MAEDAPDMLSYWMPTDLGTYTVRFVPDPGVFACALQDVLLAECDAVSDAAAEASAHFLANGNDAGLGGRMADIEYWERIPASERLAT